MKGENNEDVFQAAVFDFDAELACDWLCVPVCKC